MKGIHGVTLEHRDRYINNEVDREYIKKDKNDHYIIFEHSAYSFVTYGSFPYPSSIGHHTYHQQCCTATWDHCFFYRAIYRIGDPKLRSLPKL